MSSNVAETILGISIYALGFLFGVVSEKAYDARSQEDSPDTLTAKEYYEQRLERQVITIPESTSSITLELTGGSYTGDGKTYLNYEVILNEEK